MFKPKVMKRNFLFFALTAISLFFFTACLNFSSNDSEEDTTEASTSSSTSTDSEPENLADAMNKVQEAMKEVNNGEEVEVVNFRDLKEMLPDKAAGIPNTDKSGETAGAMGIKVSTAEAEYKDGDKRIEMTIIDTGGFGMAMMSFAQWSTVTVDKESDDGYERTTTIEGHKAFESWNSKSNSGEVAVIVNKRFVVQADGRNVDMKDLKKAVKSVDFNKLEKL
jgi:hypothetical protein